MVHSKKRKVLVLTPTYPRSEKSANIPGFIRELCNTLAQSDYSIDVIAPYYEGAKPVERFNKISVYRFRYSLPGMHPGWVNATGSLSLMQRINLIFWRPFFRFFLLLKARKLLQKSRYEAIHAHWLVPQGWVATKLLSHTAPIPLICTVHGDDLANTDNTFIRKARKAALARADKVTVSSRTAHNILIKNYGIAPEKIAFLSIGSDLNTLFCRMPYVKRQKYTLLYVGPIQMKKGLRTLVHALAIVQATVPDIKLFVIGDGPDKDVICEEAKEYGCFHNIQFSGNLAPPAVALFYNKARMVVVPTLPSADSDNEEMKLVCIEAMGCKCPVIASKLPPIEDAIIDGETGLLFEAGDAEDLAEKIQWIFNHPQETKIFVANAHTRAIDSFDFKKTRAQYSEIIKTLTQAKH